MIAAFTIAAFLSLGCLPGQEFCQSASECRYCHGDEYRSWEESRHRHAWTNATFQAGFAHEAARPCVQCHTPLGLTKAVAADEGISCQVCHVRAGVVLTPHDPLSPMHVSRQEAALTRPEFCAGCHEFTFRGPMQATFSEWRSYRDAGGEGTCQTCHMPGGDHSFRGAHDVAWLKRSVRVDVAVREGRAYFSLRSAGVGHELPTGDIFRRLTLEVRRPGEAGYTVIETMGRTFALRLDPATGEARRELSADTSIKPFEPRLIQGSVDPPFSYRLVYHYAATRDEPEDRPVVLASGSVK